MSKNFKHVEAIDGKSIIWTLPNAGSKHYGNVPERALATRIIRAIAKEGKQLKKAREGTMAFSQFGAYYIVDLNEKSIIATNIDLQKLAKELGLMQDWEVMADDEIKKETA